MRVLVNALSVAPGGGATVANGLLRALAHLGDDVYTVLVKDSLLETSQTWPANVSFLHVGRQARPPSTRSAWEQIALPRILRRGRHDLLFGIGGFGLVHGTWPQLIVIQNANLYDTRGWSNFRLSVRRRAQSRLQLLSLRNGAIGVCVSRSIRDLVRPHTQEGVRLAVVPNGIDTPPIRFVPERYQISGRRVVLWVGSNAPHKAPHELVRALGYLEADQRGLVEVRFAGAFAENTKQALLSLANQLDLGSSIVFLGHLSQDDLLREYGSATVFVSTSRLEASPLTPLEAMAKGTPIVLTDIPSHAEVAPHSPRYNPGEPQILAEHLRALLRDPGLQRCVAEAGLKEVRSRTWAAAAESYREQFRQALAG